MNGVPLSKLEFGGELDQQGFVPFNGNHGTTRLVANPQLRRMMRRDVSTQELREAWLQLGGTTLRDEGVLVAIDGRTSLEEALSVTHCEDDPGSVRAKPQPEPAEAIANKATK